MGNYGWEVSFSCKQIELTFEEEKPFDTPCVSCLEKYLFHTFPKHIFETFVFTFEYEIVK
jgi:hypothetical protein